MSRCVCKCYIYLLKSLLLLQDSYKSIYNHDLPLFIKHSVSIGSQDRNDSTSSRDASTTKANANEGWKQTANDAQSTTNDAHSTANDAQFYVTSLSNVLSWFHILQFLGDVVALHRNHLELKKQSLAIFSSMSSTTPLLEDVYYLYIQSQNRNLDILLENVSCI